MQAEKEEVSYAETLHLAKKRTHPLRAGGEPGAALCGASDLGPGPDRILGLRVARMREKGVGPTGTLLIPSGGDAGPRMSLKSATVPWKTPTGQRRGRPRKESPAPGGPPGCIWPQADGACYKPRKPGLAVCAHHAEILSHPSHWCLWPGCIQSSFGAACTYHDKVIHLLIDAPR